MLFLHQLPFFLFFILLSPSMVSAELGGPDPTGLIRLQGMKYRGTYLRVPVPGKTANPTDMITFANDEIVNFEIFRRPGGSDVYLTKQNKDRIFGRWRKQPQGYIQLQDRLSELVFWEEGEVIKSEKMNAEVQLPPSKLSSKSAGDHPATILPDEYEGTWYRAVDGLQGYSHMSDVIIVHRGKPPQLGQLQSGDMSIYPPNLNEPLTMKRLVGGWLLWPGRDGWQQPNDLLLIWIAGDKLQFHLTSVGSCIGAQIHKARSGNSHP